MLTNSPSFPEPPYSLLNTNSAHVLLVHSKENQLSLSYMRACTNTFAYINTYKRANTGWGGGGFQENHCASLIAGQAMREKDHHGKSSKIPRCSDALKKLAALNTLSNTICSSSSPICISAQSPVNESVALSLFSCKFRVIQMSLQICVHFTERH